MPECEHENALAVRGGSLHAPEDGVVLGFEAAWCPECGAYREDSALAGEDTKWRTPLVTSGL